MKFQPFYQQIRSFFAENPSNYEEFKSKQDTELKIRLLLESSIVIKSLEELEQSQPSYRQRPEHCPKDKARIARQFLNEKSTVFPQLTDKAALSRSKKSGRRIVATKKILPGTD